MGVCARVRTPSHTTHRPHPHLVPTHLTSYRSYFLPREVRTGAHPFARHTTPTHARPHLGGAACRAKGCAPVRTSVGIKLVRKK